MSVYVYRHGKDKRFAGVRIVKRSGDWVYLDIDWWWGGMMINLWRA